MLEAAVLGGAGYVGGELIRLLLAHPRARLTTVMSRSRAGEPVWKAHPHLRGFTDLVFEEWDPEAAARDHPLVFLCLDHHEAHAVASSLARRTRLIDLSADFRLKDPAEYEARYGPHDSPELLPGAVYGLTEWRRGELAAAGLVAGPGCFSTGTLLGLLPLAEAGLLDGWVCVDGKTGSSGSGSRPAFKTHHPERAADFRAYSIMGHRHIPEIRQELSRWGPPPSLIFAAHSAPMVRGLFTTIYVRLARPLTTGALREALARRYAGEPFVRLVESPRVSTVAGTNFCEIMAQADGEGHAVVAVAIDNLGKGAAGQAIQNMNAMHGWPETEGLLRPAVHPV